MRILQDTMESFIVQRILNIMVAAIPKKTFIMLMEPSTQEEV
jgi:hypothetical protein